MEGKVIKSYLVRMNIILFITINFNYIHSRTKYDLIRTRDSHPSYSENQLNRKFLKNKENISIDLTSVRISNKYTINVPPPLFLLRKKRVKISNI